MVKNRPAVQETWVWFLGWEDPLEKWKAIHSSNLAWRIPWTEELGGLQSMQSQRVRHYWETNFHTFTFYKELPRLLSGKRICLPVQQMQETWVQSLGQEDPLEKEMATHSIILAWEVSWAEEPGVLQSMGLQRVRHDWANIQVYKVSFEPMLPSFWFPHKLMSWIQSLNVLILCLWDRCIFNFPKITP